MKTIGNNVLVVLMALASVLTVGCSSMPEPVTQEMYMNGHPIESHSKHSFTSSVCEPRPVDAVMTPEVRAAIETGTIPPPRRLVTKTTMITPPGISAPVVTQLSTFLADEKCRELTDASGNLLHTGNRQQAIVSNTKFSRDVLTELPRLATDVVTADIISDAGCNGCGGTPVQIINQNSNDNKNELEGNVGLAGRCPDGECFD